MLIEIISKMTKQNIMFSRYYIILELIKRNTRYYYIVRLFPHYYNKTLFYCIIKLYEYLIIANHSVRLFLILRYIVQ